MGEVIFIIVCVAIVMLLTIIRALTLRAKKQEEMRARIIEIEKKKEVLHSLIKLKEKKDKRYGKKKTQ